MEQYRLYQVGWLSLKTYTATPTEADYEFLAQETNKSVDWVREQVAAIVPTL